MQSISCSSVQTRTVWFRAEAAWFSPEGGTIMGTLEWVIVILVLLFLFGGGGFYWSRRRA